MAKTSRTASASGTATEQPLRAGEIDRLLAIMARLRDAESGCPWDIVQTFDSIAPYTIEEAHEVADAIARRAWDELRGELGDLLFQVVYHAQMAREAGLFDFADVVASISDKMVARHPHVFGDASRDKTPEQQTRDWEAIKAAERAAAGRARILDGVAAGLPALTRARKLQERAARVGFDWPDIGGVAVKIAEEARELAAARADSTDEAIAEEFGDMMFAMVNLARHLGLDPEAALRHANAKFSRRFNFMEDELHKMGKRPEEVGPEAMEALWTAAKEREKASSGDGADGSAKD